MPDYRHLRAIASSPGPATPSQPNSASQRPEDVSQRSMKLKVLYTFDNENKTNCLARWPQSLNIRTAFLDENTQIGIIELKICIQAIVTASPELVAKLGQDYTVYAYDYSEYETPLVGQGMLSWVLASASSTPSAPAHQSRTMVTGRVCKNILGLFSSSSQETLEVKLRLVPVPTSLQSEYIESMKKYRDISQMLPEGFDPQAWTNFMHANPNFLQLANQSRCQSPATTHGQTSAYGIEHVQSLLNTNRQTAGNPETQRFVPQPSSNNDIPGSGPVVQSHRPSSAASNAPSVTAGKKRGRPPSKKKAAAAAAAKAARSHDSQEKSIETPQTSAETGYASNDERVEEGSNRKRAKVTQAEWSGKADFGKQPDSLRVAASTAASVRIHQPSAIRPTNALANSLEGPPREPTPVPNPSNRIQRPQLPVSKSSLRHASLASEEVSYTSPYALPGVNSKLAESALTSPEASQAESSPVDIASSPPIYRGVSTIPSSPDLPDLPHYFDDSGFMSGSIDELFEDDEMRPIDDEDLVVAAQYKKRPDISTVGVSQEPEPELPFPNIKHQYSSQQGHLDAKALAQQDQIAKNARLLSRTVSSGSLAAPPTPASDPVRPSTFHRSQTWSGYQAPHPASEIASISTVNEPVAKPASRSRRGSETGAGPGKRKQAIQSKLASSVAAGEMPPFCENCGAIETPTWRKAWVKIHSGTPEHVCISEDEGGIIAWQTLQTDKQGKICLYRIIKKSILKTDEGFSEVLLCNPCGLWLHTRKCMRPREVWEKVQRGPDEKRRRDPHGPGPRNSSFSGPNASKMTGEAGLHSDTSSPANGNSNVDELEAEPQLPIAKHRRASSEQTSPPQRGKSSLNDGSAAAALERAIKSSPHKFMGSQHMPIDLEDLTPKPTRRVLFPSPTLSQNAKSKFVSSPSSVNKAFKRVPSPSKTAIESDQADKENCPPTIGESALNKFFEEDEFTENRATTPTRSTLDLAATFKTPTKSPRTRPPTTGDFFSSAAKALLRQSVTPKRTPTKDAQPLAELTPFTAHLNQLLSDANNAGSPNSNSFDFPSLPSLHNTPGRTIRTIDFDFSTFDSQDLLSTDVPMPSSPPAWFGIYKDPGEHGIEALWSDYQLSDNDNVLDKGDADAQGCKAPVVADENLTEIVDFAAVA